MEMEEHEHHFVELVHEGGTVLKEEGLQGAIEHYSHDALIAITKVRGLTFSGIVALLFGWPADVRLLSLPPICRLFLGYIFLFESSCG